MESDVTNLTLNINGRSRAVDCHPEMPLLWVLRDLLQLPGTKYGCGIGACGVCTVHLDGAAVRSCQLPASACEGARITTIEGLDRTAHAGLLNAWRDNNVPQCGYCQPGQVMTAAALLAQNPAPGDEDIDRHMSGVLCRCGTYPRIRKAVSSAALSRRA